jgi:hypothetical protein
MLRAMVGRLVSWVSEPERHIKEPPRCARLPGHPGNHRGYSRYRQDERNTTPAPLHGWRGTAGGPQARAATVLPSKCQERNRRPLRRGL